MVCFLVFEATQGSQPPNHQIVSRLSPCSCEGPVEDETVDPAKSGISMAAP